MLDVRQVGEARAAAAAAGGHRCSQTRSGWRCRSDARSSAHLRVESHFLWLLMP